MAPANLALYFTGFDPGGTERQMIELARRLDPLRWAIHVARRAIRRFSRTGSAR